jgi:hypothetical protein
MLVLMFGQKQQNALCQAINLDIIGVQRYDIFASRQNVFIYN